jgi:hypothetical protein
MHRAKVGIGRRLPQGWGDAGRQLGLIVAANILYEGVRGISDGRVDTALANAHRIVDFERGTGTFFEPSLQAAVLSHQWLVDASNWIYMNSHFVVSTAFLVWLYIFRNEAFYFVRNMLMVSMALALIGYALFPAAPPRMLGSEGFVDTIQVFVGVGSNSSVVSLFINPFAAVPSMHVAFALMIGLTGALVCRHAVSRALWSLYPLLVTFVVIATGNHFWFDAVAGAAVACMSAVVAQKLLARVGPEAWSWRGLAGEATA